MDSPQPPDAADSKELPGSAGTPYCSLLLGAVRRLLTPELVRGKLRHMKNLRCLYEQKLILIGQHPVQQIERSSKELYFYRQKEAKIRKLY